MSNLFDRNNKHMFLHEDNKLAGNSFIKNVNILAQNLEQLIALDDRFTDVDISQLAKIAEIDIASIAEDLAKDSLDGYRKLDIDLLTNFKDYSYSLSDEEKVALWNDTTKQVYYDSITVYFTDRTSIYKEFTQQGVPTVINNHHQLYSQLDEWDAFKTRCGNTMYNVSSDTPIPNHELLRIWDGEGEGSFVDKVVLHVAASGQNQGYDAVFAGAKEYSPVYSWANTSSILTIISQKINEILAISTNIKELMTLKAYLTELTSIYAVLDKLASTDASKETIFKYLGQIQTVANNINKVVDTSTVISQVELIKDKADKVKEVDSVIEYEVTHTMSPTNDSNGYYIGDILESGMFSLVVTQIDVGDGRVLDGVITPAIVNADYTGYHVFTKATNATSVEVYIKCKPKAFGATVKNLVDIYSELKQRVTANANSIVQLYDDIKEQTTYLEALEKLITELEISGDGTSLSGVVLKNSSSPQTINSDVVLGLNKRLQGTKVNGSTFSLLGAAKLVEGSTVRDVVALGSTNDHLHMRTGNDPVHGDNISVQTSSGIRELIYADEVADKVAFDFLVGFCLPWGGAAIPEQAKEAVGGVYNIADYPEAGAVLGSKYGGDGVTTFGTPDLRGQAPTDLTWVVVLGKDNGSSTRLYCGREGIYCGLEGLYAGKKITT